MDVGKFFGALTGGGGIKMEIKLIPQSNYNYNNNSNNNMMSPTGTVPMDHFPSWKLHKNPFWRVKHPNNAAKLASVTPMMTMGNDNMTTTTTTMEVNNKSSPLFAYESNQDIGGVVMIHLQPGKKVEHLGIKVQFIGRIDMGFGVHEGRPHYDFISLSKELSPPGVLYQPYIELPFLFRNMDKEHESYRGRNISVRYFIKVILERKFLPPLNKEQDVWVQVLGQPPTQNEAIKMEVGIEDCLHIEFEYERRVYHLQDTILGKIHFLLVRIKIKHMELAVIRRETSGDSITTSGTTNPTVGGGGAPPPAAISANTEGQNVFTETQTLVKYEIMDGAPVKGEVIPVKLSLRGIPADLTPTYAAVNNRFSVRYFLNLVLVDEEDRRYFKQQEIILWRKDLG